MGLGARRRQNGSDSLFTQNLDFYDLVLGEMAVDRKMLQADFF